MSVIPVNISVMHQIPLDPKFYDMTLQNGFFESQHDTRVPNEFRVFTDTESLKNAFCGVGDFDFSQIGNQLASLIESMRQKQTGVCPGYKTDVCPKDSYCVPSLDTMPSMAHVTCVSREEMFPPIFDSSIEIKSAGVALEPLWGNIGSAVVGGGLGGAEQCGGGLGGAEQIFSAQSTFDPRFIRFGKLDDKSPSCARIKVTAARVGIDRVLFDQTGCLHLDESAMAPTIGAIADSSK